MMYLIWRMDDIVVITRVMAEQLTGLMRLVKGQRVGATPVIPTMLNFGGLKLY